MSRSYKHSPYGGDNKSSFMKKYANKKVRRTAFDSLPTKGKGYKKVIEQWAICDVWDYCTFEDYCNIRKNFFEEDYDDITMYLKWSKYYFRK